MSKKAIIRASRLGTAFKKNEESRAAGSDKAPSTALNVSVTTSARKKTTKAIAEKQKMAKVAKPKEKLAVTRHRNKKEGTTFGCKTVVEFAKIIEANFYENEFIGSIRAN